MRVWLLSCLLMVTLVFGLKSRIQHQAIPLFKTPASNVLRGVFHVHSEHSHDSSLSLETLTLSAAKANIDFIVLTDHNHLFAGNIELNGVMVLAGAELSTAFGHLIQLGGKDILAPDKRNKLELIEPFSKLQAMAILAHPSDPKRPWTGPIEGIHGIEIANFASSARHMGGRLLLGLTPLAPLWWFNSPLAFAQFYGRDERALSRWDGERSSGIVGFCGADVHGWIELSANYTQWQLVLPRPKRSKIDPRFVLAALREGSFYCASAWFNGVPAFEFYVEGGDGELVTVKDVPLENAFFIRSSVSAMKGGRSVTLVLLRDGEEVMRTQSGKLIYTQPRPGTYRVEARIQIPKSLVGTYTGTVVYSNRIRITSTQEKKKQRNTSDE
jgi:hypothetical protein